MRIHELVWPEDRIDHIARHGVTPDEVEQVCFGRCLVQQTKSQGDNPVYYVRGQSDAGRYLFCVVIQFQGWQGIPRDGSTDDKPRKAQLSAVEKTMKTRPLPRTDSIKALARFWDGHDLMEFEDQLEEVVEPVFERPSAIPLNLESAEINAVRKIAKAKGIGDSELIRRWVREKIRAS